MFGRRVKDLAQERGKGAVWMIKIEDLMKKANITWNFFETEGIYRENKQKKQTNMSN